MKKQPLKKLTESDVNKCIALYQAGNSLQKIAIKFNVSRQSMHDLLKRRITLRSQTRSGDKNHFYRGGAKAKGKAHDALEYAIIKGDIKRPEKCSVCGLNPPLAKDGRSQIQGHHYDYSKPLDVIWVCKKCHHEIHRKMAGNAVSSPVVQCIAERLIKVEG